MFRLAFVIVLSIASALSAMAGILFIITGADIIAGGMPVPRTWNVAALGFLYGAGLLVTGGFLFFFARRMHHAKTSNPTR